jgi:hypothetical protein
MNRALCWKEWREHRLIWLAVACLAVILVGGMVLTMAPRGALSVAGDHWLQNLLFTLLVVLAVSYGLVCGGMMLAGEKESGTQGFLDVLTGGHFLVWRTKVVIGAGLTVSLTLTLFLLGLGVGMSPDGDRAADLALILLVFSCGAFAWGLLGSSLCQTALGAAGLGAAFFVGSWAMTAGVGWLVATSWGIRPVPPLLAFQVLLAIGAFVVSGRTYCRTDRLRRRPGLTEGADRAPLAAVSLLWLGVRQGRILLLVLAVAAPLFGALVPLAGAILWPLGTLLVGILCGHAAFSGDQSAFNYRFLSNQRLPLGRVWAIKNVLWLTVAVAACLLIFLAALVHVHIADWQTGSSRFDQRNWIQWLRDKAVLSLAISPAYFLSVWVVYGFVTGLLATQLFRKAVIAIAAATVAGVLLVAVWLPSLMMGGVLLWQVFGVPLVLLVASRFVMRPWTSDRLGSRRSVLGMLGIGGLTVALTAVALWYRVAEVPDVGEPFDVQAYLASMPTGERNEAGRLLLKAAADFQEQDKADQIRNAARRRPGYALKKREVTYDEQVGCVLEKGWGAARPELGPWLHQIFEGAWARQMRKVARLPLGMPADPRDLDFWHFAPYVNQTFEAARLMVVQALRIQAEGDGGRALDYLADVLGLSRQLRYRASLGANMFGVQMEGLALLGLQQWLMYLEPREDLLQRAGEVLRQHQALTPPPSEIIKFDYFVLRNGLPLDLDMKLNQAKKLLAGVRWEARLARLLSQLPWERERQQRLLNAVTGGVLRKVEEPLSPVSTEQAKIKWADGTDEYARLAFACGLDVGEGVVRELTPAHWGKLLARSGWDRGFVSHYWDPLRIARRSRCQVEAARLQVALALYQVHHGRPAASLDDLVPRHFAELPLDPYSGKPFRYRISKGERINPDKEDSPLVQPGQGILQCESEHERVFLVPYWPRK